MAETAGHRGRRRTRGATLMEFLLLAGIVALIVLGVLAWVIYWTVETQTVGTILLGAAGVIVIGGGILLVFWLWVTDHWDGEPWRDLANEGRGGQPLTVETADGVRLHVEVEGPPDAPVTVVFCHGYEMNASAWRHQRASLASSRVRRVSYDQRGHGRSGTRKLDQRVPGVRQLADDLAHVIDAVAPTGYLVLAGHSMGGMAVLALNAVRPDLTARVGGYLLCSTTAGPFRPTFGLWRVLAPVSAVLRREAAGLLTLFDVLPGFVTRLLWLAPYELAVRYLAVHRRSSKTVVRPTVSLVYDTGFRQAGDLCLAMFDHDERAATAAMGEAYTVVIMGDNDRLVPPREQRALAAAIPEARPIAIPKCSHQTILESPQIVNDELGQIVALVQHNAERLLAESAPREQAAPATTRSRVMSSAATVVAPVAATARAAAHAVPGSSRAVTGASPASATAAAEAVPASANAAAGSVSGSANAAAHAVPAGSDTIRDAVGNLIGEIEDIAPQGPVRSGLHAISRILGVDDRQADRERGQDPGQQPPRPGR